MHEYKVMIIETLATTVPVLAETAEQAEELVRSMYRNCKVVLTAENYADTDFEVIPNCTEESAPSAITQ